MTALRDIERASIRQFLTDHQHLLTGRVLDYGSGKQPYRDIVESAGGKYVPFDLVGLPGSCAAEDSPHGWEGHYDAVVLTQVAQYLEDPEGILYEIWLLLRERGGVLLATGPVNWPIVEKDDLRRYTPEGFHRVLDEAGFRNIDVRERAHVDFQGERWCIGWQATASA